MAKDIMTSGIEMSDVIKTTGFPVPGDMEGKTFAECVSGSGGNVTLYAWIKNNVFVYTLSATPSVDDNMYVGDVTDGLNRIREVVGAITAVGENAITVLDETGFTISGTYTRDSTNDIVLQAGQDGGIVAEPLAVTENGVYTASDGKAYSPVTVNVPRVSAFRYFDGRESGYATMPTGFWVIRKDQTSGNAHCLITDGNSNSQSVLPIRKLDSNGLMVDEYFREYFIEVTEDVVISAL